MEPLGGIFAFLNRRLRRWAGFLHGLVISRDYGSDHLHGLWIRKD